MALGNLVGTMVYPDGTAFTGTLTLRLNGPAKDSAGNLVMPAYQNFAISSTGVVDIQIDDTESLTSIASTQVLYEMMLDDDGTPFRIGDIKMGTGTTYLADAWINALNAPHSGLLCYVPFNNMVNKYPRRAGNDIGTFSSAMAYRTAKLKQGIKFLGKANNATGDTLSFIRGAQIAGNNYANYNTNQGSISFWLYRMGGGSGSGNISQAFYPEIFILETINRLEVRFSPTYAITVDNINANTWYHIVIRWDNDTKIDGTNYACVSVNDVHTFGVTSSWATVIPEATLIIGSHTSSNYLRAILDDLAIFDRILGDGTYPAGVPDEIAAIYNSGNGAEAGLSGDPSLKTYLKLDGSGNLTSGTNSGMGCSFPWAANLVADGDMEAAGTTQYSPSSATLTKVGMASGTNHLNDTQTMRIVSNAGVVGSCSQTETPGSSTNYFASFWGKGLTTTPFSFLGQFSVGSNETSFSLYEMALQATSANADTLALYATSGGTGYVDNLWVGTSLLANGGFEVAWTGGTIPEGWTRVGACVGTKIISGVHGGANHLRVEVGDSSGTHYQQQLVNLTNNKWYLFVGYLLAGAGTCNINLSGGATTTLTGTQTTWTRKAHVFKSTGTLLDVRCYANSGGTANYDDFAIIGLTDIDVTASPAAIGSSYDTGKWGTTLGALRVDGGDTFTIPGTTTIGSNIAHGTSAISCWVYAEGWNGGNSDDAPNHFIWDIGQNATTSRASIYTTIGVGGTNLKFLVYGDTASGYKGIDYQIGTASFGSNTWHHVLASWTAAGPDSLWFNGSSVGTSSSGGVWSNLTTLASGQNIYIGSDLNGANEFDGLIDDVRIYDVIPSNANKTIIYNDNEYLGQT